MGGAAFSAGLGGAAFSAVLGEAAFSAGLLGGAAFSAGLSEATFSAGLGGAAFTAGLKGTATFASTGWGGADNFLATSSSAASLADVWALARRSVRRSWEGLALLRRRSCSSWR